MSSMIDERPGRRVAALLHDSGTDVETLQSLVGDGADGIIAGSVLPSREQARVLAAYLRMPVALLRGEPPTTIEASLRAGEIAGVEDVLEVAEHGARLLAADRVTAAWGLRPAVRDLDPFRASAEAYFIGAGATTAARLRGRLGLGTDQPVEDVTELVESLGFPVERRPMPDGVHGMALREEVDGFAARVVLINSDDWWGRQRYTAAHELCHVLYDDQGQVVVERADPTQRKVEARAESFARHLLLPAAGVAGVVRAAKPPAGRAAAARIVADVAFTYGCSVSATLRALEGLLPAALSAACRDMTARALMREAGREDDWDAAVEQYRRPEPSERLTTQVLDAYARGLVSLETVAAVRTGGDEGAAREELRQAGWFDETATPV